MEMIVITLWNVIKAPQTDLRVDRIEQLLDIKFYGTKNPNYDMRNFISAITLKGID